MLSLWIAWQRICDHRLCIIFACAALAIAYAVFPGAVIAQSIAIYRPLENNPTVVKTAEIDFEVVVSAFDPITEVKVDGKAEPAKPSSWITVKRRIKLEPGRNVILVEAGTEFEQVSKEFVIDFQQLVKAAVKEALDNFRLIVLSGIQRASNPLQIPDGNAAIRGTRTFLIAIPQVDIFASKRSTVRFQGIFARDRYDKPELTLEEVAFNQLTARYMRDFGKYNNWSLGAGYNSTDLGYKNLLEGQIAVQEDQFLFGALRLGFGKKDFAEFTGEIKNQDLKLTAADPDQEEDSLATTVTASLEGDVSVFRGKLKGLFTDNDAEGKFKDKTITQAFGQLTLQLGGIFLGTSLKWRRNSFAETDPNFGGVAPEETLVTYGASAMFVLTDFLMLLSEYFFQEQTSNVPASEYENASLSLSLIWML